MKQFFILLSLLGLAGCSAIVADQPETSTDSAVVEKEMVAFIMPDATRSVRWDSQDRPAFLAAMEEIDPSIEVLATSAPDDAGQLQQAEAALAKGAKVIVVTPITAEGAAALVAAAQKEGAFVVAYDGLIIDSPIDAYVSFGNEKVGELQAQHLVDNLEPGSSIAMINGEQACDACIAFKVGAHKVLDPYFEDGTFTLAFEQDTEGWLSENAQKGAEQALTATGDKIDGWLVANDGMAIGVIAALKSRGLEGTSLVTGQDATISSLQEMLIGNQTMTVFKDMRLEAKAAAELAVALMRGNPLGTTVTVNNGSGEVPSVLLDPSSLLVDGIKALFDMGFVSESDVCTEDVAVYCN